MAGVRAAGRADHVPGLRGEEVRDLALGLIAELGPDDDTDARRRSPEGCETSRYIWVVAGGGPSGARLGHGVRTVLASGARGRPWGGSAVGALGRGALVRARKARVFSRWHDRQTVCRFEYSRAAPPRAISTMWSTSSSRARRRVPQIWHRYRSRSIV